MAYIPLHHKYRPQTFADLVGQEAIATTLTNALRLQKIAPAYLFTGPRGTGKTSSARILAKSLNCIASQVPTAQPCGKCDVCRAITLGAALDIIEIDAASNTGVDNIREIIERAQYAPVQCRYKVYIIDECLIGESLILTSNGWTRIDDRTLVNQKVLSYDEHKSIWEWKKVLRWLDRGEKQTLTIKTTEREISCTGNHLIRTDRGWMKAQELKPGMKILSPLSPLDNKQKNFAQSVPVDVVHNYLFPHIYNRETVSIASNPTGNNMFTSKDMESGKSGRQNSLLIPRLFPQNNSDSSMAHCWEMVPSPTPINTANYPDWHGHMELVSKNGYRTKPVDCQNYDLNYELLPTKDMVCNLVPVKLPVIHNWQKSLQSSNRQEREKQLRSSGCGKSPQKVWHGGISMMAPLASAQKEVQPSIYIQKAILSLKTNLSLTGLQNLAMQPMLSPTKKANNVVSTTILDSMLAPVVNGWQTYNLIQSHQWHTSLEMVESVNLAGIEKVYDLEVEDNHNFVANGLLVHNCHMLTTAAFNSLLKTLEEPPDRVVFVLATTDPQRVLPTIISRCQRFDYRRIPVDAMVKHLTYIAGIEQIEIAAAAVKLVAQIAQGGLRDAESLLDRLSLLDGEITPDRVYDAIGSVPEQDLLEILQAISRSDPESLLDLVRNILERGKEPLIVLQNLAGCYRDLLIAKTAPKRPDLVALTSETWLELGKIAQTWQISWILAGQKHLKDSEIQLKHTTQPQLWLEIAILGLLSVSIQPASTPLPAFAPPAARSAPPQPSTPPAIVQHQPSIATLPPAAQLAPPVQINTLDLASTWEQVLQQLLPASRDLFKPFGKLIAVSEEQVVVAMKSSTMQTIAGGKVPELAKVFSHMFNRSIAVKLEVMGKSQVQPSSAAPAPPATPLPLKSIPQSGGYANEPPPNHPSSPHTDTSISAPTAREYLSGAKDLENQGESNTQSSLQPIPELLPALSLSPPQSISLLPTPPQTDPSDPFELDPPTDFAEPPDSVDLERAENTKVFEPEEPEIEPLLQVATDHVVKLFNGEIIDQTHQLFDRIVGT